MNMFNQSHSHKILAHAQEHWVEIKESTKVGKNDLRLLIRADFAEKGMITIRHYQVTFMDCLVDYEQNWHETHRELLEYLANRFPGKTFMLYDEKPPLLHKAKDTPYKVYLFMDEGYMDQGYDDENYFVAKNVQVRDISTSIAIQRKLVALLNSFKMLHLKRRIKKIHK